MRRLSLTLACALSACLAGCVPWPHHVLTAPRISGMVIRAGKPAAGVRVQLADVMTAQGTVAAGAITRDAVTDAQGHFALGPIRRFTWKAHVSAISVDLHTVPWGLQLSSDGATWRPGWLSDATLYGEVVKVPLVARCNLDAASRSSVIGGNESLVGNGSCTLTAMESSK